MWGVRCTKGLFYYFICVKMCHLIAAKPTPAA
jgi:hypothetical protein